MSATRYSSSSAAGLAWFTSPASPRGEWLGPPLSGAGLPWAALCRRLGMLLLLPALPPPRQATIFFVSNSRVWLLLVATAAAAAASCRRDAFTLNLLEIPQGEGSGKQPLAHTLRWCTRGAPSPYPACPSPAAQPPAARCLPALLLVATTAATLLVAGWFSLATLSMPSMAARLSACHACRVCVGC